MERLVAAARALPGVRRPFVPAALPGPAPAGVAAAAGELASPQALRRRLGRLLSELAQRLDPALTAALHRAAVAWDAFDAVAVLDPALRDEASDLLRAAAELSGAGAPAERAVGLEVATALSAALGLVELCERRLATLVRLRLQAADAALLPDGRPFLDIAAALAEAALGWA